MWEDLGAWSATELALLVGTLDSWHLDDNMAWDLYQEGQRLRDNVPISELKKCTLHPYGGSQAKSPVGLGKHGMTSDSLAEHHAPFQASGRATAFLRLHLRYIVPTQLLRITSAVMRSGSGARLLPMLERAAIRHMPIISPPQLMGIMHALSGIPIRDVSEGSQDSSVPLGRRRCTPQLLEAASIRLDTFQKGRGRSKYPDLREEDLAWMQAWIQNQYSILDDMRRMPSFTLSDSRNVPPFFHNNFTNF